MNKTLLCRVLNLNRSSLYHQSIQESKDSCLAIKIQKVMLAHPFFGAKRLSWELSETLSRPINHKRVSRVMIKYNLQCQKRGFKYRKKQDLGKLPMDIPNLFKLKVMDRSKSLLQSPNQVWCSDFTYLKFQGRWKYLFTILDAKTREILNFNLVNSHQSSWLRLTISEAVQRYGRPDMFHSDQGSEFTAEETLNLLKRDNIQISMSKKASPWENSYQERFYGNFKLELKYRLKTEMKNKYDEAELYELVAKQIHYYNNYRFHTSIKDKPARYRQRLLANLKENKVSKKVGG